MEIGLALPLTLSKEHECVRGMLLWWVSPGGRDGTMTGLLLLLGLDAGVVHITKGSAQATRALETGACWKKQLRLGSALLEKASGSRLHVMKLLVV